MPNSRHNVDLTVDSSNQYQFTGGSDGHGNCNNRVNQGAAPVQVTLLAPNGYRITSVDLSGSGSSQMSAQVTGQGQSAVVTNPCTSSADVDYTVNVAVPGGGNIPCHPKIVNT
jgi:hypothetical protein